MTSIKISSLRGYEEAMPEKVENPTTSSSIAYNSAIETVGESVRIGVDVEQLAKIIADSHNAGIAKVAAEIGLENVMADCKPSEYMDVAEAILFSLPSILKLEKGE